MKPRTIKLPLIFAPVFLVAFVLLGIVIPFYLLPKLVVVILAYLLKFVGIHIGFNILTWTLAMVILFATGILKFVVNEAKSISVTAFKK